MTNRDQAPEAVSDVISFGTRLFRYLRDELRQRLVPVQVRENHLRVGVGEAAMQCVEKRFPAQWAAVVPV